MERDPGEGERPWGRREALGKERGPGEGERPWGRREALEKERGPGEGERIHSPSKLPDDHSICRTEQR